MKMNDGFIWFFFPLSKSETIVKPGLFVLTVPIHTDSSAVSHDLSFCSRVLKKNQVELIWKWTPIRVIRRSKKSHLAKCRQKCFGFTFQEFICHPYLQAVVVMAVVKKCSHARGQGTQGQLQDHETLLFSWDSKLSEHHCPSNLHYFVGKMLHVP